MVVVLLKPGTPGGRMLRVRLVPLTKYWVGEVKPGGRGYWSLMTRAAPPAPPLKVNGRLMPARLSDEGATLKVSAPAPPNTPVGAGVLSRFTTSAAPPVSRVRPPS